MIQNIDAGVVTSRMANIDPVALPVPAVRTEAAGRAETTLSGDQVAISPQGREFQAVREKVKDNQQIREALVREMKKKLALNPFPAGAVADLIAEKIINGWGVLGQRR